jgi:hypothetical protein
MNNSSIISTIWGFTLVYIYNINYAFVGDTAKALILGAVGAIGGFLMNKLLKKYSK